MSPSKKIIPSKIIQKFDLKKYSVSKKSAIELTTYQYLPLIEIVQSSPLPKQEPKLRKVILLRKSLHLLLDTICDPQLLLKKMTSNKHLLLKRHLFTVYNIQEMQEGTLISQLSQILESLKAHCMQCELCQARSACCGFCSKSRIYHFDLQGTRICGHCCRIFHLNCFISRGCPICAVT